MDDVERLKLEHQFQSTKLAAEQAQARQALDRQHHFEARKEYARQVLEYSLQYERHLKDYGQLALRSVFLLNGGAILSLLAFIGAVVGRQTDKVPISAAMFVKPFSIFAIGLVCATIAMTFAYFNYSGHHAARSDPGALANNMIQMQEKWPWANTPAKSQVINWSFRLALTTGILSLISFAAGSFFVAQAFSRIP